MLAAFLKISVDSEAVNSLLPRRLAGDIPKERRPTITAIIIYVENFTNNNKSEYSTVRATKGPP
jgi:hypothetical protein